MCSCATLKSEVLWLKEGLGLMRSLLGKPSDFKLSAPLRNSFIFYPIQTYNFPLLKLCSNSKMENDFVSSSSWNRRRDTGLSPIVSQELSLKHQSRIMQVM